VVTLTTSSSSSLYTDYNNYEHDGQQCSDSAIISTIPRVSSCCPASAIVFAEDVLTKETVRCDVIVDKISAIQILTTTKELHLEEAPSKFHIQGLIKLLI
jgi:nuclear pore complex protein Nup210